MFFYATNLKMVNFEYKKLIQQLEKYKNFQMKYLVLIAGLFFIMQSCNNTTQRPTTALDTGNSFIRASLDGNFKDAKYLLLQDTTNIQLFSSYEEFYKKLPAEKKKNYKEASYNVNKFSELNDSTAILNYSNSYMNQPLEIKLVYKNKEWQVDFKHTSSANQTEQ